MERAAYLGALAADGTAFAEACAAAGMDAEVPPCPGWTVADLVHHMNRVTGFWVAVVGERLTDPGRRVEPEREPDDQLVDRFRVIHRQLVEVLTETPDDVPVWTWTDDHSVGFVVRRIAHETAVHRWDAQSSAGAAQPLDAPLASDGIDEFLEMFLKRTPEGEPLSVHLHCTDVPGEWTVRQGGGSFELTRQHAKGDIALRGSASDLLLALWRRVPVDRLDVVGDQAVAAGWLADSM